MSAQSAGKTPLGAPCKQYEQMTFSGSSASCQEFFTRDFVFISEKAVSERERIPAGKNRKSSRKPIAACGDKSRHIFGARFRYAKRFADDQSEFSSGISAESSRDVIAQNVVSVMPQPEFDARRTICCVQAAHRCMNRFAKNRAVLTGFNRVYLVLS